MSAGCRLPPRSLLILYVYVRCLDVDARVSVYGDASQCVFASMQGHGVVQGEAMLLKKKRAQLRREGSAILLSIRPIAARQRAAHQNELASLKKVGRWRGIWDEDGGRWPLVPGCRLQRRRVLATPIVARQTRCACDAAADSADASPSATNILLPDAMRTGDSAVAGVMCSSDSDVCAGEWIAFALQKTTGGRRARTEKRVQRAHRASAPV